MFLMQITVQHDISAKNRLYKCILEILNLIAPAEMIWPHCALGVPQLFTCSFIFNLVVMMSLVYLYIAAPAWPSSLGPH